MYFSWLADCGALVKVVSKVKECNWFVAVVSLNLWLPEKY